MECKRNTFYTPFLFSDKNCLFCVHLRNVIDQLFGIFPSETRIGNGFSVNMIIFNGAMGRVPYEIMEAAQIDGVGFLSEIGRIIIPMTWPTLSTIIVTTVANIFVSSGPILLLTQGDCNTSTIAYWIYLTTKNQLSIYYPSTVAFACTVVSVPLVLLVKKLVGRLWTDVSY